MFSSHLEFFFWILKGTNGKYSCNKITKIWIQISRQNLFSFFLNWPQQFLDKHQRINKFASNLQRQTIQILTNDVQMLILCLSYFTTTVFCHSKWFKDAHTLCFPCLPVQTYGGSQKKEKPGRRQERERGYAPFHVMMIQPQTLSLGFTTMFCYTTTRLAFEDRDVVWRSSKRYRSSTMK